MKALLLAGGKGTRLKPLTNNLPKPMVPILGEPLLKRTILNLKQFGINEIILSICYQPTEIYSYFGNGEDLGVKIEYVTEDIPLGTGVAIKNAASFIDDTFLVLNSDIVSDIKFDELIKFHKLNKGIATITLTTVENPTQFGVVELMNGTILSFKEKPKPEEVTSNLINAGMYVFEPEILNHIPENEIVSIEKEIFPLLIKNGYKLAGYYDSFYWMDIGTPEKYMQVHNDILDNKLLLASELNFDSMSGKIIQKSDVNLLNSINIIEPVYLGKNVEIGSDAVIGPYAIIGDNVKINSESRIVNSVVWDNVVVGKSAVIKNTIVGSNCEIGNTKEICDSVFVGNPEEPMAI